LISEGQGLSANGIYSDMHSVCGNKCFTRPAIEFSCKVFALGRGCVVDKE